LVESNPQSREVPFEIPEQDDITKPNRRELRSEEEEYYDETEAQEMEAEEEEEELEESEYQNFFALKQHIDSANNALGQLYEEGTSYGKPDLYKYGLLLFLAVISDALDLLAWFFVWTGAIFVLAKAASIFIDFQIIVIFWFTNTKHIDAKKYLNNLPANIEQIRGSVAVAERSLASLAQRSAKWANRTKSLSKYTVKLEKAAQYLAGSPMSRLVGCQVLNSVPYVIDIFPFSIAGVVLSYMAERHTYKNAERSAQENIAPIGSHEIA
jgi:hypothetical protein